MIFPALLAGGLAAPLFWLVALLAERLGHPFDTSAGDVGIFLVIPGAVLMGGLLHVLLKDARGGARIALGALWGMPLGLVNLFLSGLVFLGVMRVFAGYDFDYLWPEFTRALPQYMVAGSPLAVACGLVLGAFVGLISKP